jgi:hypothetical protein
MLPSSPRQRSSIRRTFSFRPESFSSTESSTAGPPSRTPRSTLRFPYALNWVHEEGLDPKAEVADRSEGPSPAEARPNGSARRWELTRKLRPQAEAKDQGTPSAQAAQGCLVHEEGLTRKLRSQTEAKDRVPPRHDRRECTRRESNPHTLRYRNLNPARLPVPPLVRGGDHSTGGRIGEVGSVGRGGAEMGRKWAKNAG